jgi:hypothetical protein
VKIKQPATAARILFDSSLSSAHPTRHLLFIDDDFDIHMKVAHSESGKEISGQVIPRVILADRNVQVKLSVQGEALRSTTATGEFGQFRFEQVPAGNASIEIVTETRRVTTSFAA